MTKILFITWDGPQTSYMEGLFMPIFAEVGKRADICFHVMQFTWANEVRTEEIRNAAACLGIKYTPIPIIRTPTISVGSLITILNGTRKIREYIKKHHIDILMPRSTFPALMVNRLKKFSGKIIFDADGLPIEERVDFAGLKSGSLMFKFLKSVETKMLKKANAVITRSHEAIEFHLKTIGESFRHKFSVVINGRSPGQFVFSAKKRNEIRQLLNISENCKLFLYVGSLGTKYALEEMLLIYQHFAKHYEVKFLILSGDIEYAKMQLSKHNITDVLVKHVSSNSVPSFISAADIGFALIYPTTSMRAAVPTKLGEYLLTGLPTIASKGIGDTEAILRNYDDCYLYDHDVKVDSHFKKLREFEEKAKFADREKIRQKSLRFFSLDAAAESYLKAITN